MPAPPAAASVPSSPPGGDSSGPVHAGPSCSTGRPPSSPPWRAAHRGSAEALAARTAPHTRPQHPTEQAHSQAPDPSSAQAPSRGPAHPESQAQGRHRNPTLGPTRIVWRDRPRAPTPAPCSNHPRTLRPRAPTSRSRNSPLTHHQSDRPYRNSAHQHRYPQSASHATMPRTSRRQGFPDLSEYLTSTHSPALLLRHVLMQSRALCSRRTPPSQFFCLQTPIFIQSGIAPGSRGKTSSSLAQSSAV